MPGCRIDFPSSHVMTQQLSGAVSLPLEVYGTRIQHPLATTVDLLHHILAGMHGVVHRRSLDCGPDPFNSPVLPGRAASRLVSRRMKVSPVQLARTLAAQTPAFPQTDWTLQLHQCPRHPLKGKWEHLPTRSRIM